MRINGRRGAVLVCVAFIWTALAALSGCASQPGSGGCAETTLTVESVTVEDPDQPVTLAANLSASGKPVADAGIGFFVNGEPRSGGEALGKSIGEAPTGADGTAKLELKAVTGLVFSTERITGYTAKFVSANRIGGVQYCFATSKGELRVP